MSDLNSHRSAGNSLAVAERSISVPSITVAPWALSAAIVWSRIGSTTEPTNAGSYVPARQTPIRLPWRARSLRNCV